MHLGLKKTRNIFLATVLALGVTASLLLLNLDGKVSDNVYLVDTYVGGMSRVEVDSFVNDYINELNSQNIKVNEDEFKPYELGFSFDKDKTTRELMMYGNLLATLTKVSAVETDRIVVLPEYEVDENELDLKVRAALEKFEYPAEDARFKWNKHDGWEIVPEKKGRILKNKDEVIAQIKSALIKDINNPDLDKIYPVDYDVVKPDRYVADIEPMLEYIHKMEANPVEVYFGQEAVILDFKENALDWFELDYDNGFTFDKEYLAEWVSKKAEKYKVESSTVTVKGFTEKVSEYTRGETFLRADIEGEMRTGRHVNEEELMKDIIEAVNSDEPQQLRVLFEHTPITVLSEIPGVEFPDRIAHGYSDYSHGNQPNRVHNIKTAVDIQNGVVIAPGDRTSFNTVGGWVTYGKGFVDGQVIMGTGLVDAAGGGVCQVSTTMYRAVTFAGMDVDQRKPHSWDVHYYQDVHGVDATIYPPAGVDLGFTNNTPGHVLVHGYVDEENETVYFDFYGIDDGREVTLGEPWKSRPYGAKTVKTPVTIEWGDGSVENREIVSSYWR